MGTCWLQEGVQAGGPQDVDPEMVHGLDPCKGAAAGVWGADGEGLGLLDTLDPCDVLQASDAKKNEVQLVF